MSSKDTFTIWGWIKEHWGILTTIFGLVFAGIIFATRLDAKVEVISGDVKDIKVSVDKLKTDAIRTGTQVEQLQRSVERAEEFKHKSGK